MKSKSNEKKKMKIAFICTGNTCRSPMAQFILIKKLKDAGVEGVLVRSFGLRAKAGPLSDNAVAALKRLNVPFTKNFRSKLPPKNLADYDAVICMERYHKLAITPLYPNAFTLGELCGFGEVDDPYGCGLEAYIKTAKLFDDCFDDLVKEIRRALKERIE